MLINTGDSRDLRNNVWALPAPSGAFGVGGGSMWVQIRGIDSEPYTQ